MQLTEQQIKALAYALELIDMEAGLDEESQHLPGAETEEHYKELHALFSDAYAEKMKAEAEQC